MKKKEAVKVQSGNSPLCAFVQKVIGMLKKNGQYPAAHTYNSTLNSVASFLKGENLPMAEVFTAEKLKAYESWLTEKKYDPNTISTYMRNLKAVYNRWMPPGTAAHDPKLFKDIYTRVESQTKRALTAEQMRKLESTNFNSLPERQQRTLAYFLLMFMLRGMPFIDLAHLRKADMQGQRIIYLRHKTNKRIVVDIPAEAMPLIRKYKDNTDSIYLFPILEDGLNCHKKPDSRKRNKTEKEDNEKDSSRQYHHYQDVLRKFNRSLEAVMKQLLPGVKVSSYTARHTWATLAYHIGVSVGIISQSMGHSSILVTMTYLKPFEDVVIDQVNKQVISLVRKGKWKNKGHATFYRA